MRNLFVVLVMVAGSAIQLAPAKAETSCNVCAEQQKACMKNYAGPTCKFEYQMCIKSCKK